MKRIGVVGTFVLAHCVTHARGAQRIGTGHAMQLASRRALHEVAKMQVATEAHSRSRPP
jgi:hypothetical protein